MNNLLETNKIEVRFYVGLGQDCNGQWITASEADIMREQVRTVLAATFEGVTEYAHHGVWADAETRPVSEYGITCVTIIDEDQRFFVEPTAQNLKRIARQSCVLVTAARISAHFVA